MSDFEQLRKQMVERQLKHRGIFNTDVLHVMGTLKRELFIPSCYKKHAYEDNPLPVGYEQTISQPYIVALMTEALELKKEDVVLEIGTGSGYQTAILARIAGFVYTVERIEELALNARQTFAFLGIDNVKSVIGDGTKGLPEYAPFDKIIVTASAKKMPDALIEQLKAGGQMITPVGGVNDLQELVLIKKNPEGLKKSHICYVRFVPLIEDKIDDKE